MTSMENEFPISADLSRRIEGIEIEAMNELYTAAKQELGDDFPAAHKMVGSAWLAQAPTSDVLALNRVVGLGLFEPADEPYVDLVLSDMRKSGAPRFFVQVSPFALPENLVDLLEARGLTFRNNWVKLIRTEAPVDEVESPFEVKPIDRNHADRSAHIAASSFDWPDWMGRAVAASVGKSRWRYYCAFDKAEPIATGGLYMSDDLGYISLAATMTDYRGQGAQQALAARRINDAISFGCRTIAVETAEDTPQHSAPSFRNMLRLGFRVAYKRPNYIWEK